MLKGIMTTNRNGSLEEVSMKSEASSIVVSKETQERLDVRLEETPYVAITNTEILEIFNT